MQRAILFDWDGTLAHTLPIWMSWYKAFSLFLSLELTDHQIAVQLFGHNDLVQKFIITPNQLRQAEDYADSKVDLSTEFAQVTLHPGAQKTIKKLHDQGYSLAITTSSDIDLFIKPVLERQNLTSYFDALVDRHQVKNNKPAPDIFLKALDILNVEPKNSIIVGDGDKDIVAAKTAGIKNVLFYPPEHHIIYSEQYIKTLSADRIITDLSELPVVIEKLFHA
ncbi:hypothetical protein CO180_02600 [candidate division WWE3 bacterium CG_4_9_14_3_um_filter_41_6]|uniref:HAD family hydrolase n=1 Tax=candidate division WWE3 bacterium CG_4_10_14_0_2_um_filter_41_14 TaxID=1975072 RepID=A0A2M7TJ48_UNCKA|nr:MAG: hypothetical protein COY32_04095 [candidate division WWE3 bacterium CG_4_10_14_0_2_um_filter_41_14]PJA38755.1 MAG: hypothetical protein CO180_02600 [candidate division WWE3 bacterium CG_4_9_14_3_um_filter_41_6]